MRQKLPAILRVVVGCLCLLAALAADDAVSRLVGSIVLLAIVVDARLKEIAQQIAQRNAGTPADLEG